MTDDQHTTQDPTTQYSDSLPADQLEHPGLESEMSQAPDFGEATYRGSGRLEGRKAVVTGGDSGIGRAVALAFAFAREGADVAISYLEDEQSLELAARPGFCVERGRVMDVIPRARARDSRFQIGGGTAAQVGCETWTTASRSIRTTRRRP